MEIKKVVENIGKIFGRLEIIGGKYFESKIGSQLLKLECKCSCGNIKYIGADNVIQGYTVSCGCLRKETAKRFANKRQKNTLEEHLNQTYGELTVISEEYKILPSGRNNRQFVCTCSCGNNYSIDVNSLFKSEHPSCGCYTKVIRKIKATTHGMVGTRIYSIWSKIVGRCTNPKNSAYKDYGERGITICNEWLKFENFYEDMKDTYSDILTIDRTDNDKGYSKDNCRWANRQIQCVNQRKKPNCLSGYKGVTTQANGKYQARLAHPNGKRLSLGTYIDELDAAKAVDDKSEELYGNRPNNT
jgi:hypothetical protein